MTDTDLTFEGVTEKPVSDFLLFEDEKLKGTEYQGVITFDNNYELSIIRHNSSYGGKMGLFEIALSKGDSSICMPPITADGDTVNGYLTKEQVIEIIEMTGDLPGTV
mgnify:FL=1